MENTIILKIFMENSQILKIPADGGSIGNGAECWGARCEDFLKIYYIYFKDQKKSIFYMKKPQSSEGAPEAKSSVSFSK